MAHRISRRDFMNGAALAIAAGLTPAMQGFGRAWASDAPPPLYPPALTGLRGNHDGAFDAVHALAREGKTFDFAGAAVAGAYDLIVVGGGIAGLSAAYVYRARNPEARVLIVDNHDDFGGHAKRNEFEAGGRTLIAYGGSESFQSPKGIWSDVAKDLVASLGIDIERFYDPAVFHRTLYPDLGMSRAYWFDKETFGQDKLVTGDPGVYVADDIPTERSSARPAADFVADMPVSDAAKAAILKLFEGETDYLAGMSAEAKAAYLDATSYRSFLKDKAGLPDDALACFQKRSHDFFAIGIDGVPASWAMETGYPGFGGLGLESEDEAAQAELEEPYIYHFPDGNASLARLLVKALIPDVAPGGLSMDDIVQARFDYGALDRPGAAVAIKLNTTAVLARNVEGGVEVGTVTGPGQTAQLWRAKHVVLACSAGAIPWVCPELPEAQKAALSQNVRAPLIYAKVLIANWTAFRALGAHNVLSPSGFWAVTKLDYPVSMGGYAFPKDPSEPMVLHMVHVPVEPGEGLTARDQWRMARLKLLESPFAYYEDSIRDQLQRMLGAGGFDAARDIRAITVNRWSHGYSYFFNPLFDDMEASEGVVEAAKAKAGAIAIGLSDTGWDAYAHIAIDEAHRAVGELLGDSAAPSAAPLTDRIGSGRSPRL